MKKNLPDWKENERYKIDDTKFNAETSKKYQYDRLFPGYVLNDDHPFTYCYALSILDDNHEVDNRYCAGDSPCKLADNIKKQPKDWKYATKEVYYRSNSSGYRTYEWNDIDWKEAIVIFGCSCTYGVGQAQDETIDYYLERLTKRQVINLGVPGGSNSLMLQNASTMVKRFGMPYGVVMNWTTADRTRYFHKRGFHDVGPWDMNHKGFVPDPHEKKEQPVRIQDYYTMMYLNPFNESMQLYYNALAADAIFEGNTRYIKISYFDTSAHITRSEKFFKIDNGARDLIHPGSENSKTVARYIYSRLKQGA